MALDPLERTRKRLKGLTFRTPTVLVPLFREVQLDSLILPDETECLHKPFRPVSSMPEQSLKNYLKVPGQPREEFFK